MLKYLRLLKKIYLFITKRENEAKRQLLQQSLTNQSELNGLLNKVKVLEVELKTQKDELSKTLFREKELTNKHKLEIEMVKQQASDSIAGINKKIESEKVQLLERELSEMIIKQTNLRELTIQEKNLEINGLKNKLDDLERETEKIKSEAASNG